MRGHLRLVLVLLALAPCASASAQPTSMAGYIVAVDGRSQTVHTAPPGWVGRKTIDKERRVSNSEQTRGTEATFTFTFGGFTRSCPTADGVVDGNFEYTLTSEVWTVPGQTLQRRYSRQLIAQLRGEVGPDARLISVELFGAWTIDTRETGMPSSPQTQPVRQTFRPGSATDWPAVQNAVLQTGDLGVAAMILWAGDFYQIAETNWNKENECVEFAFDPPSGERSLAANESARVRIELRTKAGGLPVPWTTATDIHVIESGTVSSRSAAGAPGKPASLTYTASSQPRRGHGFELAATSRAGVAAGKWVITERDIRLSIESRIWDDRGSPRALVGEALFDGTVRLDVTLKPSPLPGQFRGSATVERFTGVGHVSRQCLGSAKQSEEWDVIATIDAPNKSIRLSPTTYPSEGMGSWSCGQEPLTMFLASELQPMTIQAITGTPQSFRIPRDDDRHETFTVTVVASPVGQAGGK
jgi:hypothetical protein